MALIGFLSVLNLADRFYEEAVAYGIVTICLILFTVIYLKKIKPANEHYSRDRLEEWIINNQTSILKYGARYGAENVLSDTKLIQYCIVYSAVAFTQVSYTGYCIKGSERSTNMFLISTIFSAVMGWWALPSGPIETLRALHKNICRSQEITVKDLLAKQI